MLIAVRHTSVIKEEGKCYGCYDLPLAPSFKKEAEKIKKGLLPYQSKTVFSSPISRCTRLAGYIATNYQTNALIREFDYGHWENKHWDEIDGSLLQHWMDNYLEEAVPGGESYQQFIDRIQIFLDAHYLQAKNLLLITHAGVIKVLYHLLKGIPKDKIFEVEVEYGSIHCF